MNLSFASLAIPPFWEKEAVLLVESLRAHGKKLSDQPVTLLTLKGKPLSKKTVKKVDALDILWAEFEMDEVSLNFPLAVVAHGAAAAEQHLPPGTDLLVWLLPDTLILREPADFLLPEGRRLGYRPVHHKNIGSNYAHPPDDFWQRVYQHYAVPEEHIFRMETCYREAVRPYFNAGILVTRPQDQLLNNWLEAFQRTFQHPDFTPFFKQRKYAIFMHQAILAGTILKRYTPGQITELPESYNYPLHMHAKYPDEGQAESLNDLVTVRYEKTRLLSKFLENIQVNPPLYKWFTEKNFIN